MEKRGCAQWFQPVVAKCPLSDSLIKKVKPFIECREEQLKEKEERKSSSPTPNTNRMM